MSAHAFVMICTAITFAGRPCAAQSVQIVSPVPEQILPGPDVPVHFATEGIAFSPGGCNLHIILDDGHFAVQYDPKHPYLLRDVAPGSHTLRVFAADRLHRAMPGTLDLVTFSVGYQDEFNRPAAGVPLLTVNLPQSEYLGVDAGDVAIDFMVDGVDLSRKGYHVAYYVDGRKHFAYAEGARHLKGLPPGFHSVRFELLDERGVLVPGAYNSWEKMILLSPHKTRHVPTEEDVRRGLPLIESIPGAMTNGQPWIAGNPDPIPLPRPTPITVQQIETVVVGDPTVAPAATGFAVRAGGRRVGPLPEEVETVEAPDGMVSFPAVPPAGSVKTEPLTVVPVQAVPAVEAGSTAETTVQTETVIEKKAATSDEGDKEPIRATPNDAKNVESGEESKDESSGSSRSTPRQLSAPRKYEAPTTSTVKVVNASTTGSTVKRTSAVSRTAGPTDVAEKAIPSPAVILDPDESVPKKDRNKEAKEARKNRKRDLTEPAESSADPNPANQLPAPVSDTKRVGP